MQLISSGAGSTVLRVWTRAIFLALLVVGCGGGGGVDSGGTGSSFTSGPITGFGSVIVGGVHFDDTSATVQDVDGTPRSRDDLRLGMTTEIRASDITADPSGISVSAASTIVFGGDLLGPVDSVDVAGAKLVVLGQTVDVNATTVFDDATLPGGLSALAAGNVVEVSALFDAATGHYIATRMERKTGASAYRLRGVIGNIDTSSKTFEINGQQISYAPLSGPPPTALVDGGSALLRLEVAKVGARWIVAALNDGVQRPRDRDEVRIEGLIGSYTSPQQFNVKGVPVDASHVTVPAGLGLGVRVEVEGRSSGGVLVADEVKIETLGEVENEGFELRGLIASVNPGQSSFVIRGVTITYSLTTTDFRNGTAANVLAGTLVEARGTLSANGTSLLATRITFR